MTTARTLALHSSSATILEQHVSVSTFFTGYAALRGEEHVEAIAVIVDDARPLESPMFVVVDQHGAASVAHADELNLYGAYDDEDQEDTQPR
jgi:hypothetical protein